MTINNVQLTTSNYIQSPSSDESAAQQLADLIAQYRAHEDDADPTQLLAIMQKISDLLTKDGSLIEEECFQEGYRPGQGGFEDNYVTFLTQSISLIKEAIDYHKEHPSEPIPRSMLEQLNDSITQLHFLMINPNP